MEFLIIASALCILDQLTKYWTALKIPLHEVVSAVPGIFHFTNIHNTGAAFSILSSHTWILTIISAVGIIALSVAVLSKKIPFWERLLLSLVLGGAIGNFIDRLFLGYVVDMIEIEFMRFAIFNFADICINVGAIGFALIVIIDIIKSEKKKSEIEVTSENGGEEREERD